MPGDKGPDIARPPRRKVILVATHMGIHAGGEAMKAYQYADYLEKAGVDLTVILHERSFMSMGADPDAHRYIPVVDTRLQRFMWAVPPLRLGLDVYFHLRVRALIGRNFTPSTDTVVHYIAPISPVTPRFPPKGFHVVIGPVAGNIYHPPAFAHRMPRGDKLRALLHRVSQRVMGALFGDKKRADKVLNSGYDRTRVSLRLAGCRDEQMIDVVDSGVNPEICALPRVTHAGQNARFMCSGRVIDLKAFDLAIRALARTEQPAELSLYGDGPELPALKTLVRELGLGDRVTFHGWVDHKTLMAAYPDYRGYLFPSLADSNGIVMQEAMMVGLPVVALRWGGPAGLADDTTALFVDPVSEEQVIDGFAKAMDRLARDPGFAEQLSTRARSVAQEKFTWDAVSKSWMAAY